MARLSSPALPDLMLGLILLLVPCCVVVDYVGGTDADGLKDVTEKLIRSIIGLVNGAWPYLRHEI